MRGLPCSRAVRTAAGFTLVELMAALAVAALLMALAVPASVRMYDAMRYRDAVREVVAVLSTARYQALISGRAQDVEIVPERRQLRLAGKVRQLPAGVKLAVRSARELNREREGAGVIRFYPEGGASGGAVDVESPGGRGVKIQVDWLLGDLSQEVYALP
ncbi:MAG: prepilin-type N-terminal cleavage/methylation domain-containing protein [Parahaliea sp.]